MLEVLIIICLAISLFLLLRHYPEAKEAPSYIPRKTFRSLFSYFKKPVAYLEKEIEAAVTENRAEMGLPESEPEPEPAAIRKYGNLDPELAELLCKADELFEINDLREAEERSIEAITKNKRCGDAYLIIGKVAFMRGQFDDAREALRVAIKCDNKLGEAYNYLGKVEMRGGNLSKGVDHLEKAVVFEKGHPDWYADLGKAYMEIRQYAKAAKVLKRAASLDIENKEYKDLASEAEDKQRSHSSYFRGK